LLLTESNKEDDVTNENYDEDEERQEDFNGEEHK